MATKIEELQVLISANADQFKSELISVKQELQRLNQVTQDTGRTTQDKLFGSMFKANIGANILTSAISNSFNAMKSFSGAILEGGSNLSRLKIATDTVTSNLGLTREQVQGLRNDLADANTYGVNAENVIRTLALSGLIDLSKSLQAVDARTGKTVQGVTALTLAMKDLSAANAIDSSVGIERISRFIQRGEASLAQGLIEIGEINREYKAYADIVGKTTDTLSAQERAQVRLNIVMREGAKTFGAYANTYETSGKALGSIRDITQSLTEQIGSNLEPIFRVGTNAILQLFIGVRNSIFQTEDSIQQFAIKVAGYLVAVIRVIGSILMQIPVIGKNFESLANFSVKPIKAMQGMAKSTDGFGDAATAAAGDAKKLGKELGNLAGFDELNVLPSQDNTSGSGVGSDLNTGITGVSGKGFDLSLEDSSAEINKYADEATAAFKKVGDTINNFLKPLKNMKLFGKPVVDILKDFVKWSALLFVGFKIGQGIFSLFTGGLSILMSLLSPITSILSALGTILGGLSAPILVIIGVIALLTAGFILLYQNSEEFRDLINQMTSQLVRWFVNDIVPAFKKVIDIALQLIRIFIERWPEIQRAIQPFIDLVKFVLIEALKLLGNTFSWLWNTILKPVGSFILNNLAPAFSTLISVVILVINVLTTVGKFIGQVLTPVFQFLWSIVSTVFNGIGSLISMVWNNVIKPALTGLWDFITGFIVPVFNNLLLVGKIVWDGLSMIVRGAWNNIYNAIKPVVDWIGNYIMPIVGWVAQKFGEVWEGVKQGAMGIWGSIAQNFKNGINTVIWLINGFMNSINKAIEQASGFFVSVGGQPITFRVGQIPYLANGGEIQSQTLAMLGEGGHHEAVLPLDQNTGWAEKVAELINASGKNGGQPLIVKIGEKTVYEGFVDYVNDRSLTSNLQILNI